jgi:hypothetical protein
MELADELDRALVEADHRPLGTGASAKWSSTLRHSRPPKPGGFCAPRSSTKPPSMPVGSAWSRSACSVASAWTAESTTPSASSAKSPHGSNNETPAPASNRCSLPKSPRQNGPRLSRHVQRVIVTVPRYWDGVRRPFSLVAKIHFQRWTGISFRGKAPVRAAYREISER